MYFFPCEKQLVPLVMMTATMKLLQIASNYLQTTERADKGSVTTNLSNLVAVEGQTTSAQQQCCFHF